MTTVETVRAVVTADNSQYNRAMDRSSGKMRNLAGAAVKAGAVVGAAFTAAAGVIAVKSVTAFAGFESSMQEVRTLMPKLTDEAFAKMGDDVKDFGKEFGVLTTESIPALYQAISAGVDKDTVFDFLEVAQKAARGGVTDLSTAVDGISSVVNAYGDNISGAAEASDLMFTAVKLGKTNFEELSSSLFNVAPAAAALGIEFGDVTAGLASLTAMGVPTRVATTQLRAAMVELGKDGSKADKAFQQISGQSFPEFIKAGGDMAGAVRIMSDAAEAGGTSVMNLFGSIEGGQAIQSLAGDIEGFEANIAAMNDSAGATDKAFAEMDQGLSASFDKIKANAEVMMITIGEKLAPLVARAMQWIVDHFDDFKRVGKEAFARVGKQMKKLGPPVKAVVKFVKELVKAFKKDGLSGAVDMLMGKIKPLTDWMKANMPIVIGVAAAIGTVLVAAFVQWAIAAGAAAMSTIIAMAPLIALAAAVGLVAAGLVWAYQNVEIFRTVIDALKDAAVATFEWLKSNVPPILQGIWEVVQVGIDIVVAYYKMWWKAATFIADAVVEIGKWIGKVATKAWEVATSIASAVGDIVGWYIGLPARIARAVKRVFVSLGEAMDKVKTWISNRIDDIVGFFTGLGSRIGSAAGDVFGFLWESFKSAINLIIRGWNSLEFKIPGFDPPGPGPKFGGFTLGLPKIPELALGGITTGPTPAIIGEAGPEVVLPLSRLDAMLSKKARGGGGGGSTQITINMPPGSDGEDVVKALQTYERRHGGFIPITVGQV